MAIPTSLPSQPHALQSPSQSTTQPSTTPLYRTHPPSHSTTYPPQHQHQLQHQHQHHPHPPIHSSTLPNRPPSSQSQSSSPSSGIAGTPMSGPKAKVKAARFQEALAQRNPGSPVDGGNLTHATGMIGQGGATRKSVLMSGLGVDTRMHSLSSPSGSSRITSPENLPTAAPQQTLRTWGRLSQSHLSVSRDMDQFSIITTTDLTSPAAIRERILSKLHVYDDDYSSCRLYRTYIGESLEDINGPEIGDDELWELCSNQKKGDNIILLVKQVRPTDSAPPSATRETSGHVFPPVPTPIINTDGVVHNPHMKTESLSSNSTTLSENLMTEFFLSNSTPTGHYQPKWHTSRSASEHLPPPQTSQLQESKSQRDRRASDVAVNQQQQQLHQQQQIQQMKVKQRTMDDIRSPSQQWQDQQQLQPQPQQQSTSGVYTRGPRSPNPPRQMSEESYVMVPRPTVQPPTPIENTIPQRPYGVGPSGPFLHPSGVTTPRGLPPTPGQQSQGSNGQRRGFSATGPLRVGQGVGSNPAYKGLQSAKSMSDMRQESHPNPPTDIRSRSPGPPGGYGPMVTRHVSASGNLSHQNRFPPPMPPQAAAGAMYAFNVANVMGQGGWSATGPVGPMYRQDVSQQKFNRPGHVQVQSSPEVPQRGPRSLPAEPAGNYNLRPQLPPPPVSTAPLNIPKHINQNRPPSEKSSGSSSSANRDKVTEEGPYDGIQRPGSAASRRSETSTPSTPATDLSLKKVAESTLDTTVEEDSGGWAIEGDDDSDEEEAGKTWFRPPPSSSTSTSKDKKEEKDEDEGTMKADEMSKMLSKIESFNEEGTLKKEDNAISNSKATFAEPPKPESTTADEESTLVESTLGGGVSFIEDDGEDEDDFDGSGGTWVQPPSVTFNQPSNVASPSTPSVRPLPNIPQINVNNKEKPSLKLNMGLSIDGKGPASASQASAVLRTARSPQEEEQQTEGLRPGNKKRPIRKSTSNSQSSTSSGSPIVRRTSFAIRGDNNWAFRPSVEDVLEHMEDYFPDHDIDKEFIETSSNGTTVSEETLNDPVVPKPVIQGLAPPSSRIGHKKSIRRIAQDGRRRLQKEGMNKDAPVVGLGVAGGSGLLRRKSTKLWGSKIEEVTPGAAARMRKSPGMNAIPESPVEDPANFSFKWVKGDLIGKGTYGQVYLALNATTGEMLAVKQVAIPQTDSDREDKRQTGVVDALTSEVELLKDLDHPNIVQYLGMERTDLNLNVFLEYVTGGSVGRCLRKHGKFEESVVKSFTSQILDGLEYLHSRNILHRDLKADNILVDLAGVCKISDFGISKRSDNIYEINANMSLQGSIFWMAPEVVSNQKKGYSAKIDIWSLGCVVLEMFCGRRPWSDEEAIQAMFKLGAERLAPPVPPDVTLSNVAAHFLSACFIVDSEQRPTAAKLLTHVFVEIPKEWTFEHTNLGRAITTPKKLRG